MSQTLNPSNAGGGKTSLVRYEAARQALADAITVDEVKDILDVTVAMAVYAKQAKDEDLIAKATELRKRAERRLGEMIEKQRATIGLSRGGRPTKKTGVPKTPLPKPTLEESGIDKNLAKRARSAAKLPEDKFEEEVGKATSRAVAAVSGDKEVIKQARAEQNKGKKEKRAARERELAGKIAALPKKRYGVILADPEWQFEVWTEDGKDRSPDNHYTTSPLDVIKARDVPSIAADNCALFLWCTAPMLLRALEVMAAWGFDYRTNVNWDKEIAGTGYWFRNRHEHLLLGVRGNVPAPAPGDQFESVINEIRRAHSIKPDKAYEIIETYFPTVPKIELNSRRARPGWDAWGAEAPPPIIERVIGSGRTMVTNDHVSLDEDDMPDIPLALRRTV